MMVASTEKPSWSASGAMIGIDTVASPEDDGISTDRPMKMSMPSGANTNDATPLSAPAACSSSQTSKPVSPISTVTEPAMISTTDIMSAAPLRNAFTNLPSPSHATKPMMIVIRRNQVDASLKYHSPSGSPVRNADHPKTSIPNSPQGMKPTIITTNVKANTTSVHFCLPVISPSCS